MNNMKREDSKCFCLIIDNKLIAMSEEIDDIHRYISQFKNYFMNASQYQVVIKDIKSRVVISNMEYYLYPFNKEIVLTNIEIKYYSKDFRELYADEKNMLSQLKINQKLLSMNIEDSMNIDYTFEMLYSRLKSYNTFLDSLDTNKVIEQYFIGPYAINRDPILVTVDV